jgi:hypothetical protein
MLALPGALWAAAALLKRPFFSKDEYKYFAAAGLFLGLPGVLFAPAFAGFVWVLGRFMAGKRGVLRSISFVSVLTVSVFLHVFLTGLGFDYTW